MFFSAEFIKGYVVAATDCGLPAANRAELSGGRGFRRDGKMPLENFNGQVRGPAILLFRGTAHTAGHGGGKLDGVLAFAHQGKPITQGKRVKTKGHMRGHELRSLL